MFALIQYFVSLTNTELYAKIPSICGVSIKQNNVKYALYIEQNLTYCAFCIEQNLV